MLGYVAGTFFGLGWWMGAGVVVLVFLHVGVIDHACKSFLRVLDGHFGNCT